MFATGLEDLADYRENKTNAKKAVSTAEDAGYEELYTDGVPTESLRLVYKIDPMLICDQMNDALEKGIPTV